MNKIRCCRRLRPLMIFAVLVILASELLFAGAPAAAGQKPEPMTSAEQKTVHQAQQAMARKQYARARALLKAFIQKHPRGVHYLVDFTLGNVLAMTGAAAAALKHYRAAADRYPSDAAVWQNMGRAYYDLEQYAAAGDSLARAHALTTPASPQTAYQAAAAYLLAGRPAAARPLLERLVIQAGDSPEVPWLEALLKTYLDLDQPDKARELVHRLLRQAGHKPHLWQILARLHIDRSEYRHAAAALEIHASLTPADPEKIRLLGDLYRMAHVPLKAARQYETLLSEKPLPGDYEQAAAAYITARRPDRALDVLRRGLEQNPSSRMWWLLAGVYYEKADYEHAYQAYAQYARTDPQPARAHLMMGYCALQMERLQDARSAFAKAASFPRQRGEANQMLSEIDKLQMASAKEVDQDTVH